MIGKNPIIEAGTDIKRKRFFILWLLGGECSARPLSKNEEDMCNCNDLTKYDFISTAMRKYLGTYGAHFTHELCIDAVSLMRDSNDKKIDAPTKEQVEQILSKHSVKVEHAALWDIVYVYCMGKADYYGSVIEDELHLARFVKAYIDDEDGYDGIAFNRWYADMCKKGIVFDWEDYL